MDGAPSGSKGIFDLDLDRWPVVVIRVIGSFTDDELRAAFLMTQQKVSERQGAFATVMDVRDAVLRDAEQRKFLGDCIRTQPEEFNTRYRGVALVFTSQVTRGIVTALQWFRKPPYPTKAFVDPASAFDWARSVAAE